MDHSYIDFNVSDPLPPLAILAGHDSDNDPIYVGIASHNGVRLPAKFVPNKKQAYVSWDGKEIIKNDFKIMTGSDFYWIPATGGRVPRDAVPIGQTSDGEPLFVGRGYFAGSLTPGRVHCTQNCLYIPYGGDEKRLEKYELLVSKSGSSLVSIYY